MNTFGILLAGGLSKRFGSPKAFAKVEGKFYYEQVYKALDSVCDHVVIISRRELLCRFPEEMDVITDLPSILGQGPLAGIYTAMSERPAERYLVLPCDMPFIGPKETEILSQLCNLVNDVTAVETLEEPIPLFSIWNSRIKEELEIELSNGSLSVMSFLGKVKTVWVDSDRIHRDKAVFRNINTDHLGRDDDEHD